MLLKAVKLIALLVLALRSIYANSPPEANIERSSANHKIQKISLNQNGYVQFIAYKIDIPQITKYTFCTWVKSYNLTYVHPLLSTSQSGEDHNIFIYISSYGRYLVARILNQELLKVSIQIHENKWSNICQSWDSKTGWWQVYFNGKLIEQGINEALRHVQVPRSKDLLVGQDFSNLDIGLPGGLHGEVYGFNMVLSSTTETPATDSYQSEEIESISPGEFQDSRENAFILDYLGDLKQRNEDNLLNPLLRNFKNDNEEIYFANDDIKKVATKSLPEKRNYPSKHLKPPKSEKHIDSKVTSTNTGFNVQINHPSPFQPAPGIAIYQTPPPLPKYLSKNAKASYELAYVKDNFFGETPDNSKFALDVLNFLKSDRYEKILAKRNRRRPKNKGKSVSNTRRYRFVPKSKQRSGSVSTTKDPFHSKATGNNEVIVSSTIKDKKENDNFVISPLSEGFKPQPTQATIEIVSPSQEKVEIKSKGEVGLTHRILKREAPKKNIEIVNPETVIDDFREKRTSDSDLLIKGPLGSDYKIIHGVQLTSLNDHDQITHRSDPRDFSLPAIAFPQGFKNGAGKTPVGDERRKSFGTKTKEETYESLYSRLHYTGPRYKSNDRKIVRNKGVYDNTKLASKGVLTYDDLKPLKYYPLPRGFGKLQALKNKDYIVYEDAKKAFRDAGSHLNVGRLPMNRSYHLPQSLDDMKLPLSKLDYGTHRSRNTEYNSNADRYKYDNVAYSSDIKNTVKSAQLPKVSSGRLLVELSYRKCLINHGSPLAFDQTSLITWNYTPVVLYGGATVQYAYPECGIF